MDSNFVANKCLTEEEYSVQSFKDTFNEVMNDGEQYFDDSLSIKKQIDSLVDVARQSLKELKK
jgi:hypothetical protein